MCACAGDTMGALSSPPHGVCVSQQEMEGGVASTTGEGASSSARAAERPFGAASATTQPRTDHRRTAIRTSWIGMPCARSSAACAGYRSP